MQPMPSVRSKMKDIPMKIIPPKSAAGLALIVLIPADAMMSYSKRSHVRNVAAMEQSKVRPVAESDLSAKSASARSVRRFVRRGADKWLANNHGRRYRVQASRRFVEVALA